MPRKKAAKIREKANGEKSTKNGKTQKKTNFAFVAGINTGLPRLTPEQERERRRFHEATAAQTRQLMVPCGYLDA